MPEPAKEIIVRSRDCGLKDIYAAEVTQDDEKGYTTSAPRKIARAIKAKISDKWSSETIYSDDSVEDTTTTYEGTEVEIEVNALAPQDKAFILGHKYENGYLIKSANDNPPKLALGYRVRKVNGKYDFVWLYAGGFKEGLDEEHDTKEAKTVTKTKTLKGKFYQRQKDGEYHISVDESNLAGGDTEAKAAIENWFSKVQEKGAGAAAASIEAETAPKK